eukprot:TRINITY_DN463_c1_g1_i4.p2 TRINITY_DN463_c1_g1~~TRINITY_DN463_c1_g1_i4.p2  ORF type:complete len:305 (-),score=28.08 TRINITY_DN463_c1_g1_i4:219-1133(-)
MARPYSLRWAFNSSQWHPTQSELDLLYNLLPVEERTSVVAFQQPEDRKRAVISRLLQRRCVSHCFGIPFDQVRLKRTKGKKPYAVLGCGMNECSIYESVNKRWQEAPNFNFNVSHEGSYVVLVAEPVFICGVDISAPQSLRRKNPPPFDQTLKLFERCFSSQEFARINSLYPRLDLMELEFRKYWSLKEAFTKARGDGIAFGLNQTDFQIKRDGVKLFINEEEQKRWKFSVQKFGDHIFSVALGPPDEVIDAHGGFTQMLLKKQLTTEDYQSLNDHREEAFKIIELKDLVPHQYWMQIQDQHEQ